MATPVKVKKQSKRIVLAGSEELPIITGLTWRPLPPGKVKSILPQICNKHKAQMCCTITTQHEIKTGNNSSFNEDTEAEQEEDDNFEIIESTTAGLYIPKPQEEDISLPPKVISGAAAFASEISQNYPNAMLILRLPTDANQYYIVSLSDGSPTADFIDTGERIDSLIKHADMVYSDDGVRFSGGTVISWDWLADIALQHEKSAKLVKSPFDPKKLMIYGAAGVLGLSILGAIAFYQYAREQKIAQKIAQQKQLADPNPKYAKALQINKGQMFLKKSSLLSVWKTLIDLPMTTNGWVRASISCTQELDVMVCTSNWSRISGSYVDVKNYISNSNPKEEMVDASTLQDKFNLNTAQTQIKSKVELEEMVDAKGNLNPLFEFDGQYDWHLKNQDFLQNMLTANMPISTKTGSLWPVVADLDKSFIPSGEKIYNIPIAASLSGVFFSDFIEATPKGINWSRFDLKFNHPRGAMQAEDAGKLVMVSFYGDLYVSKLD